MVAGADSALLIIVSFFFVAFLILCSESFPVVAWGRKTGTLDKLVALNCEWARIKNLMFALFTFGMTVVCHAEHPLFGAILGESSSPLAADAGLGRGLWCDVGWIPC